MNAVIISAPAYGLRAKGFADSFAEDQQRLNNSSFLLLPSESEHFFPASLAPIGIADSVSRIVVHRSATLSPSLRRLVGDLSDLKPDWDGENAIPVRAPVLGDVVEFLLRLSLHKDTLREPFLAPTFDGFVQMEWHDQTRSLEIEAVPMGWTVVGRLTGKDNKRIYFEAECERSDFNRLVSFYDWFLGNELIWPSP